MDNGNKINLSSETADILTDLFCYAEQSRSKKPKVFVPLPCRNPAELIPYLAELRNSVQLPIENGEDTYKLGAYYFTLIRLFGVAAFNDRLVRAFTEVLLHSEKREKYFRGLRYMIFPKTKDPNARMAQAIGTAFPRYQRVYKKLVGLGFKKGFLNEATGRQKIQENFKKAWGEIPEGVRQGETLAGLIRRRQVSEIADHICSAEFGISASSFPKVRQQSRKISAD